MLRVVASVLGALCATGILAGLALADATPVQLVLIYMPNVSNTGTPTEATRLASAAPPDPSMVSVLPSSA